MNQTTIFDVLYPKYKITKPIRLIELFAGYGSQALALKYLGVKFEHWKICEWAVKSIQAYKDMHFTDDNFDYSQGIIESELMEYLYHKGISNDYNKPMTLQQINRLSEEKLRTIFNNISATNNLVNIQDVKGDDLAIVNKDEYDYILTYSFPCQDLSLAGKGKGMADTSTRSGMLWEVERILNELKTTNSLPQILLMENVPQVHGTGNVEHFNKWQLALEKLGYKSYFQDLIATDYGIPQTRNRCFMVSILGEYSYTFPKPIPLELKLKDLLEDEVDEKYYLSDKMANFFIYNEQKQIEKGNGFRFNVTDGNVIAKTITTRAGERMDDNFIGDKKLYIKNATKKGHLEATDGDGINLSNRMEHQRGNVQSVQDMWQVDEGFRILQQTLFKIQEIWRPTENKISNGLRIRKLSPRECWRLMGVKDEDFDKVSKNQSDASLFHLAGDSIVVNVLMAIFKELILIENIINQKEK